MEKIFGHNPLVVVGEAAMSAKPAFAVTKKNPARALVLHQALPGVLACAAGAIAWKKHRVLGGLGGLAVKK